jgi:hypothetical protein
MEINGGGSGSGTSQFRIFAMLRKTGLLTVWSKWGNPDPCSIHPGYPTSFRETREDPPRLQISTREIPTRGKIEDRIRYWENSTDRWADIDIDYRAFGQGHLSARNSDVLSKIPRKNVWHIDLHRSTYGSQLGMERIRI